MKIVLKITLATIFIALIVYLLSPNVVIYDDHLYQAKQNADNQILVNIISLYQHDHGALPENIHLLMPNYLPELPRDAWGHQYVITIEPNGLGLRSLGLDGIDGGDSSDNEYESMVKWKILSK